MRHHRRLVRSSEGDERQHGSSSADRRPGCATRFDEVIPRGWSSRKGGFHGFLPACNSNVVTPLQFRARPSATTAARPRRSTSRSSAPTAAAPPPRRTAAAAPRPPSRRRPAAARGSRPPPSGSVARRAGRRVKRRDGESTYSARQRRPGRAGWPQAFERESERAVEPCTPRVSLVRACRKVGRQFGTAPPIWHGLRRSCARSCAARSARCAVGAAAGAPHAFAALRSALRRAVRRSSAAQ